MTDDRVTISSLEASLMLNIPLAAMGQLVFENRLLPATLTEFYLDEVQDLVGNEEVLRRLR